MMVIFLAGAWAMGSHEEIHDDMQVEEFKHKKLLKHKPIIVHKPIVVHRPIVAPPPRAPVVHVVPKKLKKLHKG